MTMRRAPRLTEADHAAWAGFTRHIAPRSAGPEAPSPPAAAASPPAAATRSPLRTPHRATTHAVPGPAAAPLAIGAPPAGVDRATWQRFRTGKLAALRTLDLHGMTAQRAFHALTAFLRAAAADGVRCVEIVTGRGSRDGTPWTEGTGVIRREFPLWLNRPDLRPLVLGAAHPHAANPGAVRLLLRRPR
jgi:DNA-nicking Smr family endonuclease